MIRYVDLGDQIEKDTREFAFFDTVTGRFCVFSGVSTWESVNDFIEGFDGELLDRFVGLIPPGWDFSEGRQNKGDVLGLETPGCYLKAENFDPIKEWVIGAIEAYLGKEVACALNIAINRLGYRCISDAWAECKIIASSISPDIEIKVGSTTALVINRLDNEERYFDHAGDEIVLP